MAFRTSLSGLDASSTDLSVIGNNIANASTTGFKESRTEFADVYASTFSGISNIPGNGVRVSSITQQFGQGNVEFTNSGLDLAINGGGFFVLSDNGTNVYSRAGAYQVDRDGYVVDSSGRRLQVFPPQTGVPGAFNTGSLSDLQLSTGSSMPVPTDAITSYLNLNSTLAVPAVTPFDPASAASYNHSTSLTVYDSLGNPTQATMYFVKTAVANTWDVHTYVDGTELDADAGTVGTQAATLTFDGTGTLVAPAGPPVGEVAYEPLTLTSGANPLTVTLDFSEMTQYGSPFAVNTLSQNGSASGRLSGIDIDDSGVVFARYTNGQSDELGQVALANFANVQGLRQQGDTVWAESFSAGDVVLGAAGTGNLGTMQSGALEASNVDIAEELVSLITAQRNFQANAKAISTEDTITQTLINNT